MIIRPSEFDPAMLRSIPLQKQRGRPGARAKKEKQHFYKDIVCAFDIETTKIPHGEPIRLSKTETRQPYIAFMYVWQLQIGKGITIIGRYWDEFTILLNMISKELEETERIVIYVHNLSYEWSFLHDSKVLEPYVDKDSVFCLKPRKVCKFLCFDDHIEFRCSYIHSNMGLDEWAKKMQVTHKKLSGEEFDYSKIRYPWTELTEKELAYCANDVISVVECIEAECALDGDTLQSIPLTSTGYIRREIRAALHKKEQSIQKLMPPIDTYILLREAFRGGDTHANRHYANRILPGPIRSTDRSSSYPDIQINGRFPVSDFRNPDPQDAFSWDALIKKMKQDRAIIARLSIGNLRLRDPFTGNPYIPADKCRNLYHAAYDNGRILSAEYLEITVTDIDIRIIMHDYDGDFNVTKWQYARYGQLPQELKDVIINHYVQKTRLKNVEGKEVQYEKSKNRLNAAFGCSAMDPVRLTIHYKEGGIYEEGAVIDGIFHAGTLQEFTEILLDQSRPVMPYQWGVW